MTDDQFTACNGMYQRRNGRWYYAGSDDLVPDASDMVNRRREPDGIWAPELHPERLVDLPAAAEILGISPTTLRAYVSRGQVPHPPLRIGSASAWPRPIIERWRDQQRKAS